MSESTPSQSSERQDRLDRVLADYLHSLENGPPLDQESLINGHPDLADELRSFFRNRDSMQRMAEPLKAALLAPTLMGMATTDSAQPGSIIAYFGDYELLEEIARGGMGVVFKARQTNLKRIVAIKMILAGQLANDSDVKRFYAEAEAAAGLDHPGIVPIFEIGEHNGQHYFSMAFIEGQSLADRIAEGPLPPREAAQLMCKVAAALEFAHQRGIIHRDLKPANILLDRLGQPRITDFGLAKQLRGELDLTGTGQILGTPNYMPPEQASGKISQVGARSDVYSLGAILYCLLTGRPPFQSANPMDTLMQVIDKEPVSPTQLNSDIPPDLETICLKCLEKSSTQRYESARELEAELNRYLKGEPIHARPVGKIERAWRWCKRQPVVAGLIAAIAVSLLVGTIVSSSFAMVASRRAEAERTAKFGEQEQRHQAEKERTTALAERDAKEKARAAAEREKEEKEQARAAAEEHRKAADLARDETERALYFNRISLVHQYWVGSHLVQSRRILDACPEKWRNWEWHYFDRLHHSELFSLPGNGQFTSALQFDKDGRRLAAYAGSGDAGVRIWDVDRHATLANINLSQQRRRFSAFALSADGKTVALAEQLEDQSAAINFWDAESGQVTREFVKVPRSIGWLSFSPDGTKLAAARADARNGERLLAFTEPPLNEDLIVWEVSSGQEVFHPKEYGVIAQFSPDGSRLLTFKANHGFRLTPASAETTAAMFDTANWTEVAPGKLGAARSFTFSGDGKRLAVAAVDRQRGTRFVRVFDSETGNEVKSLIPNQIGDIALSPDGSLLAMAERLGSGTIEVWDLRQARPVRTLRGHVMAVNAIAFASDGKLASCSWDNTIRFWDPLRDQELSQLAGPSATQAERAIFAPGATHLAYSQPNTVSLLTGPVRKITVVDAETGRTTNSLAGHEQGTIRLAYSADGTRLASAGRKGDVKVWDTKSGVEICTYRGHDGEIAALGISPDGRWCASAHEPPEITKARFGAAPFQVIPVAVKVWNAKDGTERFKLDGHAGGVYMLSFSPDGRILATGGDMIKVWDVEKGELLFNLDRNEFPISGELLIFTPNSDRILLGGPAGSLLLVDLTSRQIVAQFEGHGSGRLDGVAFSPDGKRLATAIRREVKLWDTQTGQDLLALPLAGVEDFPGIAALGWTADGQRLRAALRNGATIEWNGTSR